MNSYWYPTLSLELELDGVPHPGPFEGRLRNEVTQGCATVHGGGQSRVWDEVVSRICSITIGER